MNRYYISNLGAHGRKRSRDKEKGDITSHLTPGATTHLLNVQDSITYENSRYREQLIKIEKDFKGVISNRLFIMISCTLRWLMIEPAYAPKTPAGMSG